MGIIHTEHMFKMIHVTYVVNTVQLVLKFCSIECLNVQLSVKYFFIKRAQES